MRLMLIADQAGNFPYWFIGIQKIVNRYIHTIIKEIVKHGRPERFFKPRFQSTFISSDT